MTDDHAAEREAITARVAELEAAQQHERPDEFMRLFRRDAVWVTAHGRRLVGWDEINAFTHQVLPGAMKESTATYEVVHVVFARPDVAVVAVRQRPLALDGTPLPGQPEGRPTYVMAKEGDEWMIVAGQNTQVRDA
jgi:uncharacterized protein (TIGR02246 family)